MKIGSRGADIFMFPEKNTEQVLRCDSPEDLQDWVNKLNGQEMPVFARTAMEIAAVAERRASNSSEMARVILQDAAMTSRILKMANSAYYYVGRVPLRSNINTITRAVILLGFNTVRSICEAKAVVEALLGGYQREQLIKGMAESFHAAVQARALAISQKDRSPEEVFIATLLYHLGEMAFWSFADEKLVRKMESTMETPGYSKERAAKEVLGFRFQQLTDVLSKQWHLGELLQEALSDASGSSPRVKNVMLGHRLAQSVEHGWDNDEVKELIAQIGKLLNLSPENVAQMILGNAKEAISTATLYGAATASRLIPLPIEYSSDASVVEETLELEETPKPTFLPPDPVLQLKILRELSSLLLESGPDYNLFLLMAIEGIYRGVGMDRLLFALLSKNQKNLEVKFALGWTKEHDLKTLIVDLLAFEPNLFSHILETKQPRWVTADPGAEISDLLTPEIRRLTEDSPFFIMPVTVQAKTVGLIYADRHTSKRALDEESYSNFLHFYQQINMGLSFISK